MCPAKSIFRLVALFLLFSVLSCEKRQPELVTIKLGYAPIADAAQIYVGIEKGLFQDEGIQIQLEQFASGPKILEALGAGSIQIGLSSYVPLVFASASGIDFVAITGGPVEDDNHREHAILVRSNSNIETPRDLEGRKLALNGLRNIDDLMIQELLEKHNVDKSKVRLVEIPFPRMETVLQFAGVDAVAAIEPFVTRALTHGNAKILTYNYVELYPSVPIACYVAREAWIKQNQPIVEGFKAAFDKATDFCLSYPDSLKPILAKYTKLTQEELELVGLPTFSKNTNPEDLQSLIHKMRGRGMINVQLQAKDIVYGGK